MASIASTPATGRKSTADRAFLDVTCVSFAGAGRIRGRHRRVRERAAFVGRNVRARREQRKKYRERKAKRNESRGNHEAQNLSPAERRVPEDDDKNLGMNGSLFREGRCVRSVFPDHTCPFISTSLKSGGGTRAHGRARFRIRSRTEPRRQRLPCFCAIAGITRDSSDEQRRFLAMKGRGVKGQV